MKISMKQFMVAMLGCLLLSAGMVQAATVDIIETWDGGTAAWYNVGTSGGGVIKQSFTVPQGQTATKVEMFAMQHGNWAGQAGYYVNIFLYQVYPDGSYSTNQGVKSWAWTDPIWEGGVTALLPVSTSEMSLSAGTYEIHMAGNTSTVSQRFFGKLYTGSTYAGGAASSGGGVGGAGTPLAADQDFEARITLVPEPASMLLLGLGSVATLHRRRR